MEYSFDRSKHVFHSPEFEELVNDTIRFFNGTPVHPVLPIEKFEGTGVYALYFIGKGSLYNQYHEINRLEYRQPIYVGKAVPRGWRQGRVTSGKTKETMQKVSHRLKIFT